MIFNDPAMASLPPPFQLTQGQKYARTEELMLRLIETSEGHSKNHLFQSDQVIIGDVQSQTVQLAFPGRGLKAEHIRIFKKDDEIYVINLANDPFVSLNGSPFYKKKFTPSDILKIKQIELTIAKELEVTPQTAPPSSLKSEKEAEVKPDLRLHTDPDLELQEELKKLEELTPKPLTPHQDLERLDIDEDEIVLLPVKKAKADTKTKRSLKDVDYLTEKTPFEKENRAYVTHRTHKPFRYFRYISGFLALLVVFSMVIGIETYLRVSEKSELEELQAAESLSDIAMAITYAQLHHISPQKHNWSDPEFIQNNLLATLPTGSAPSLKLNSQGNFGDSSYILRVYTSNDLSRFLLVAHPAPSLIQWLIPKNSIVVDSQSMELRKISDLKTLNRLLNNLNTLDGVSVNQITEIVKKGDLIPLSLLARTTQKAEFQPPKAVQFLRPGAENLIYNAPRYHSFSDQILKKAIHFSTLSTSSHELQMLKAELEVLKKLPHLILYSSGGIDTANEALQGLKEISPDTNFLMAYLKYDIDGKIRSSQIIIDHTEIKKSEEEKPYIAEAKIIPITPKTEPFPLPYELVQAQEVALNEPEVSTWKKSLEQLKEKREIALRPYKEKTEASLKKYLSTDNPEDLMEHTIALKEYEKAKRRENYKLQLSSQKLLDEYEELEIDELNDALEESALPTIVPKEPVVARPLYNPEKHPITPFIADKILMELERR